MKDRSCRTCRHCIPGDGTCAFLVAQDTRGRGALFELCPIDLMPRLVRTAMRALREWGQACERDRIDELVQEAVTLFIARKKPVEPPNGDRLITLLATYVYIARTRMRGERRTCGGCAEFRPIHGKKAVCGGGWRPEGEPQPPTGEIVKADESRLCFLPWRYTGIEHVDVFSPSVEEQVLESAEAAALRAALNRLAEENPRLARILALFAEGWSDKEIGKEIGLRRESVNRLKMKGMERLRGLLSGDDPTGRGGNDDEPQ